MAHQMRTMKTVGRTAIVSEAHPTYALLLRGKKHLQSVPPLQSSAMVVSNQSGTVGTSAATQQMATDLLAHLVLRIVEWKCNGLLIA